MNRQYHRLTTAYNVLFNGEEAFAIGKSILDASVEDNFFELLEVEPIALSGENVNDATLVPGFDRAEEKAVKAIQKHSMRFDAVQRNDQIDKAYLLLGKSRYYDRRFFPALEAFNFLLDSYGSQSAYLEGIIWREKTNIRLLNNEIAIGNLRPLARQLLPSNKFYGAANATVAQAFINLKELDSAQYYISQAALFEKDKDLQGRYYFINGQLLEKMGEKEAAQQAYEAILELNKKTARKYWLHAKIKQQIFQAEANGINPEETLLDLLKKYDNQAFEHVVYRALGSFYLEKNQDSLAESYFTASQKAATIDEPTQKANYRDLADFYFLRGAYGKTGAYLDSLIPLLKQKSLTQKRTQRERNNLQGILAYENQIQRTDSVLHLMGLTQEAQTEFFTNYLEQKKKNVAAIVKQNLASNRKNRLFASQKSSDYYFYRPNLVAQGKQSFLASWGTRPNVDNWRSAQQLILPEKTDQESEEKTTPVAIQLEDVSFLMQQLPSEEDRDSLVRLNHQSYLQAGLLYKEQFDNPDLAAERLKTLMTKTPRPNEAAPALYHLYRIEESQNQDAAAQYKSQLLMSYPESPFALLLTNTDFQNDTQESTPSQQYQTLLTAYEKRDYSKAETLASTLAVVLSATDWAPKIDLIRAHIVGQQEGQQRWIEKLEALKETHPQSPSAVYAEGILSQLKRKPKGNTKTYALYKWVFPFAQSQQTPLEETKKLLGAALAEAQGLKVSLDPYTPDYQFLVVHGFRSKRQLSSFQEDLKRVKPELNSNNFVVLSQEYQEIQLNKTWRPTEKQ